METPGRSFRGIALCIPDHLRRARAGAPAPHRVKISRSESPPSFRRKREQKGGATVLLFQLFSASLLTYGFAACCFSRVMIGA